MAISEINLQVKTEQGTGFSSKETDSSEQSSDVSFLSTLTQAHDAANETTSKDRQSEPAKQVDDSKSSETAKDKSKSEDNTLLSQINASQAMSTHVNVINNAEAEQPASAANTQSTKPDGASVKDTTSVASLIEKSKVATAVNNELNAANLPPKDKVEPVVGKAEALVDKVAAQSGAQIDKQLSTDESKVAMQSESKVAAELTKAASTSDEQTVRILAQLQKGDGQAVSQLAREFALSPEQQAKLEQQVAELKASGELKNSDIKAIKSLLSEVLNTQSSNNPVKSDNALQNNEQVLANESKDTSNKLPQSIEKQISALTKNEQQVLLNKVNEQLQTLPEDSEQYNKLSAVQARLTEAVNHSDKSAAITSYVAAQPNKDSTSRSELASAKPSVDMTAEDEPLSEAEILAVKEATKEPASARVVQLFNQLAAQTTTAQPSAYELAAQQHEQALELQNIQTQSVQQTSSKTVSVDPGVMQAINIVKSDAAKMLQERVSALLNINNKEAEIRLDPPEMGSMHIRIRSDAEQAQINFVVQNQQAKEALEQSMPRLREMLAQQGIELGESSIQQGESGAQQDPEQGQGNLAGNQHEEESQTNTAATNVETSRQQSSSSIDYYA
ncbi:flagellar hook-length control protein FliK [Pseudoalteromonas sp. CO302Y]|uniref:flagellar hook-length control protein FliK n=1 Tax=unclassified Pseudoalteromonas TaxID=194690 RepID=UPI0010235546|nr:flagellar hook-length control protein FliK [Pseudoalteromonas sp. CO302Y]RZG09874.1 flagellar hook-length control protein FliK [Pseudoalteromonas sp. CO133X]